MIIDLKNRTIDTNGQVILKDEACLESLLIDESSLDNAVVRQTDETDLYNQWAKIFGISKLKYENIEIDHKKNQEKWLIPEEFLEFNIEEYVLGLCKNQEETARVELELTLYKERDLLNLLKFIVYIVSIMRENDIVWGVGRGSSCSSFVLYLIGLHKVNSIKYSLDVKEFLKD